MLGPGYKMTSIFFDSPAVIARVEKAQLATLRRSALRLRLIARRSLRRRKKASAPGSPPSVHTKDNVRTLKNIQTGLDGTDSILIGPIKLPSAARNVVPGTLETGGEAFVVDRRGGETVARKVNVAPRPFMLPALRVVAPTLPNMFKGSLSE